MDSPFRRLLTVERLIKSKDGKTVREISPADLAIEMASADRTVEFHQPLSHISWFTADSITFVAAKSRLLHLTPSSVKGTTEFFAVLSVATSWTNAVRRPSELNITVPAITPITSGAATKAFRLDEVFMVCSPIVIREA